MNGANLVMLLVIIVLLFALIFLAIAEMGLSKMTKPRPRRLPRTNRVLSRV